MSESISPIGATVDSAKDPGTAMPPGNHDADDVHGVARFADWAHAVSGRSNLSLAGTAAQTTDVDPTFRLQAAQWGLRLTNQQNSDLSLDLDSASMPDMRKASGLEAMDWAQRHMPVTHALLAELRESVDFSQARIAACLILEPKTAVLLRKLKEAGASVGVCCEPGGVDGRVAEQLKAEGIAVEAKDDWTSAQYHEGALRLLDTIEPNIIIDDGASFARLAARERPNIAANLIGVAEETTSGVHAFQAMEDDGALPFPVIAVNDSTLKTGFDNAHGTGETCVTTMQEILGADWFEGRRIGVVGYGPVGRGFALRVRALGARVTICERDPVAALQAVFEGFEAQDLAESLPHLDMAVSATGVRHTITLDDLKCMRAGSTLAVIGGVPDEIALDQIPGFTRRPGLARRMIQVPDGPELQLLAEGDGVNYTVGGGNPIEIMDLSFAVQSSAVAHLLQTRGALPNRVIRLDRHSDQRIARIALEARGQRTSTPEDDTGSDWHTTRFDTR